MASVSTVFFSAKEVYVRGSPDAESYQGENYIFDYCSVEGGVETEKGIADGPTDITTEDDHFLVRVFRWLILRKENRA